ncbi:MAG: LysM peptidoglycan-binding domain-containing protein, partial [Bacteroidia bacterium]|nr:LysM peptidoglycan-binding domain-containing protein [Bacteroidia bacterium]
TESSEYEYRKLTEEPFYGNQLVLVKENQTIESIAAEQGISVRKLRRWNRLKPSQSLKSGQVLLLVPRRKAVYHIIQNNQTLEDVAFFYKKRISKLVELNRLSSTNELLEEGRKIYLLEERSQFEKKIIYKLSEEPKQPLQVMPLVPKAEPKPIALPYEVIDHTVQAGETLWKIANHYGMTVAELKGLNGLIQDTIHTGKILKVKRLLN